MVWGILAVLSALLLGLYDFLKKVSLKENAVLPVLLISSTAGGVIFLPFILVSTWFPQWLAGSVMYIPPQPLEAHLMFILKTVIVGSSWVLNYFAMKHLPLTIAGPIRSSGPLWTLAGALTFFGERLNPTQWLGVAITLIFFYIFSLSGKKEGISFRTNKWVLMLTCGTVIGAISSLFDKYLVHHYDKMAMQAWFNIYMVPLMVLVLVIFWLPVRHKTAPFKWRWSIPLIGTCLAFADFFYFWALSDPDALVAIVSTLRRASVIVSFSLGALLFREKNIRQKAWIVLGIIVGIIMVIYGGTLK